jgi:hypothetical protein
MSSGTLGGNLRNTGYAYTDAAGTAEGAAARGMEQHSMRGKRMMILIVSVVIALALVGVIALRQSLAASQHAQIAPITVTSHTTAPGFDECQAPSLGIMRAWWKRSPYRWLNIYIGGINRACPDGPSAGWVNTVYAMGWGLVPTYVGRQAPMICQPGTNSYPMANDPATTFHQAQNAANDAANALAAINLAPGTIVYDDMEYYRGSQCDPLVAAYINGWVQGMHSHGYKAGVYISASNVHAIVDAAITEPDDIWLVSRGWASSTGGFAANCSVYGNNALGDSAWHSHRLYQYLVNGGQTLDHGETWGGVTQPDIDSDCADGDIVGHQAVHLAQSYTYIAPNADGSLLLVARGKDENIWYDAQNGPNGLWNGWQPIQQGQTFLGDPTLGVEANGRLVVFAVGHDGAMWQNVQTAPGKGWGGWQSIAGTQHFVGTPAVASDTNNLLELFQRDATGGIWHNIQQTANGAWTGWKAMGAAPGTAGHLTFAGDPAVAQDSDGRLEVVARGSDNDIWLNFQITPGMWFGWLPEQRWAQIIPNVTGTSSPATPPHMVRVFAGTPAITRNVAGELEVFARSSDHRLWYAAQKTPGGAWTTWQSVSGAFGVTGDPAVGMDHSGALVLGVLGMDTNLWANIQRTNNQQWIGWQPLHAGGIFVGTPAVIRDADGRLEVFGLSPLGDYWHIAQATPGGAWGTWSNLQEGANLQQ